MNIKTDISLIIDVNKEIYILIKGHLYTIAIRYTYLIYDCLYSCNTENKWQLLFYNC